MDKIFVIAGTREQYDEYRKRKIEEMHAKGQIDFRYADIIYVGNPHALRGIRYPHGVFIGTWRDRPDILQIVEELQICSNNTNSDLKRIYSELKLLSKRPTPKLTGKQITAVYVDEAAKLLAKEIDAEVIRQLMRKP